MASSRKHSVIIVGENAFARYGVRQIIMEISQLNLVQEHATIEDLRSSESIRTLPLLVMMEHYGNPSTLVEPLHDLLLINPQLRIVLISRSLNEPVLRKLSGSGVRAFVLDSEKPIVLKQAILAVMTGGLWIGPSVMALFASSNSVRPRFTTRERQVLELVKRGDGNAAIAQELSISPSTVEFHLKNVFDKLGAHSRTDALYRADQEDINLDG